MRYRFLISASSEGLTPVQEQMWQRRGGDLHQALVEATRTVLGDFPTTVIIHPDPSPLDLTDTITVRVTRAGSEDYLNVSEGRDFDALRDRPLYSTIVRGNDVVTKVPPR